MKPSKAIVIDPYIRKVYEVVLESYDDFGRIIGDTICVGPRLSDRSCVFVDDNGLLKDNQSFFVIKGYNQPLAGIGIIAGNDEFGETIDTEMEIEDLGNLLLWADDDWGRKEADRILSNGPKIVELTEEDFKNYFGR